MVAGNKNSFAIEWNLDAMDGSGGSFRLGTARFWCAAQPVGDNTVTFDLNILRDFLSRKIDSSILPYSIDSNKAITTAEKIHDLLYHADLSLHELEDKERQLRYTVLCPGGGEPFDGYFMVYLVSGEVEFLVWMKDESFDWQLVSLPLGSFKQIVQRFLAE